MSEFRLEPWEVGPQCCEPLQGVGRIEAQERMWRPVEMRRKQFVVFVRGEAQSGNWIVREEGHDQPRVWAPKAPGHKTAFSRRGRFFAWEKDMAFVAPDGHGAWLDAQLRAVAPFWNAAPSALIAKSSREIFEFLTQKLDGDSDFAFARRWKEGGANKWALLLGGEDNYEILLRILQAVLWEFGDYVKWEETNWRVGPSAEDGAWVNSLTGGYIKWSEQLKLLLLPWSQYFAFEFLPAITQEARQRHRCLDEFYNERSNCIEVEFNGPPTQHERLEARFFLREWLQRNAPKRVDLLLVMESL